MRGSILNNIKELFKIDWINTLRFNFKYFPVKVALVFPCLLYRSKIIAMDGSVELLIPPKLGMIKLGKSMVPVNQDAVGFVYENRGGTLRIGGGEMGSGSSISLQQGAELTLGNNFHATSRGKIICASKIRIGNYFRFGWDGLIMDTDWHSIYNLTTKTYSAKIKEILIGDYVWLANGVSVMKGSVIPDFSIVAGKSLINRALEERFALYAGSPAKLIKTGLIRDEFVSFMK